MKNIFKIFGLIAVVLYTTVSCTEADNTIDGVFDGVTSGAVLRTTALISNEIPVGSTDATFTIEIEEQDDQGGALLESVNVYVTFTDGSPDQGDSTGAITDEVFLRTISAGDFSAGPFGLPRFTLVITVNEFMAAAGITDPDAIFGGDTFTTRLELNLTDGRVFSSNNAGGIITGGFFNSPFSYTTPVVCPVEEEAFTGDYLVEQVSPSIFGYDTFDPDGGGVVLNLVNAAQAPGAGLSQPSEGEALTSTQRAFDAFYLAALGFDNERTYIIDYVCNETQVPTGQTTGLTCGGPGITLGPPSGDNGAYDFTDDSFFNIVFTDDEADDCGTGGAQVELNWTKQ